MVCLCKTSVTQMTAALPLLGIQLPNVPPPPMGMTALPSLAQEIMALAAWLASLGQPAPAFAPQTAWLNLTLPTLPLNASAMATISAFAQLRADMLAQFGIDLAVPGQGAALVQLAASVQARLNALISLNASLSMPGTPTMSWSLLAALLSAINQLMAALAAGLLPVPQVPPMGPWRPFLVQIYPLLPLIAASAQLGVNLSGNITAQLAASLRVMQQIRLPAFAPPALALMASITASLSAAAQISAALNINALAVGMPRVQQIIADLLAALINAIEKALGLTPVTLLSTINQFPRPQFSAGLMVTPPVVQAAASINAQALAQLNWQVPAVSAVSALSVGLPVVAFAANLQAALGISARVPPCATGCDMMALAHAL